MTVVINGTTGIDTGTGSLIAADSTTATYLDMFEDTDNGSNFVRLIAPASIASNRTLTLPDNTGTLISTATAGTILQVLDARTSTFTSTSTGIPIDNTTPQNTEGVEILTLAITPRSATSRLLIQVVLEGGLVSSGNGFIAMALFQDSNVNALAATVGFLSTLGASTVLSMNHFMTSGTTSSTTFRLRFGPQLGATASVNGGSIALFNNTIPTSMTITEIAA